MTTRTAAVAACLSGCLTGTADTLVQTEAKKDGQCEETQGLMGDFAKGHFCLPVKITAAVQTLADYKESNQWNDVTIQLSPWCATNDCPPESTAEFAFFKTDDNKDPGMFAYVDKKDRTKTTHIGQIVKEGGKDMCFLKQSNKVSSPIINFFQQNQLKVTLEEIKKTAIHFAWIAPKNNGGLGAFVYELHDGKADKYWQYNLVVPAASKIQSAGSMIQKERMTDADRTALPKCDEAKNCHKQYVCCEHVDGRKPSCGYQGGCDDRKPTDRGGRYSSGWVYAKAICQGTASQVTAGECSR